MSPLPFGAGFFCSLDKWKYDGSIYGLLAAVVKKGAKRHKTPWLRLAVGFFLVQTGAALEEEHL